MEEGTVITSGRLLEYRLYDVAWEIDLLKVEERVREFKRLGIERKLFSKAIEFVNPPVSLRLRSFEKALDEKTYQVNAYAKVYDYGVMSIIFEVPLEGQGLREFEALAQHLRKENPLEADFLAERDRLVEAVREAMTGLNISRFEEDFTVYMIRGLSPAVSADDFLSSYDIGRLLLFEEGENPPGRRTIGELLSNRFSYSEKDLVVINWDNALVMEPTGSMDIPDLLEFANAQLLELRVYDDMLDKELDAIYDRISPPVSPSVWKIKRYEGLAAKVMRTITEVTDITEKVDNSLKVTEDVYYARVYAAALKLLRVAQWEESIKKKLDIASRVYDMLYREIANKRTELLELAIVILIVVEIVLFFFIAI